MNMMASHITSLMIIYSVIYSSPDQRKHQSSASLVFVWGIHRWPVNSPHKWPVTWKMFPFDDVIMCHNFNGKLPCYILNPFPGSDIVIWVLWHTKSLANLSLLSFFRLTTRETLKLYITDPMRRYLTVGFPLQRTSKSADVQPQNWSDQLRNIYVPNNLISKGN